MISNQIPKETPSGYRAQALDTSPEFDRLEFSLLRQRSNRERLRMSMDLTQRSRQLSLRCLKSRFPSLSGEDLARKVALARLQETCPVDYVPSGNGEIMWTQDPLDIALVLHQLFGQLQIPYYITGGVAAVAYGEPRTTRDLDMVIRIELGDLDRLVAELEKAGFYVSGIEEVRLGQMRILQIIHQERIERADLMVAGTGEFDQIQFGRRQSIEIADGVSLFYVSPEDLVLNKLLWRWNSSSDQQWRDVLGILKVQSDLLDLSYLREWALRLDLIEVLDQAMVQSGTG
ncbi:MAG: hypothetical protein HC924_17100 [Synechococcaceae cyanobacterium SM2_3_2]|nr:hypothetical protein [Synechococcaceae cyanobacterium SM2_3_2]